MKIIHVDFRKKHKQFTFEIEQEKIDENLKKLHAHMKELLELCGDLTQNVSYTAYVAKELRKIREEITNQAAENYDSNEDH